MKRKLLTLVVAVALLSTVVAGSASAQASPTLSTGDAVDTISVQPMDHTPIDNPGWDPCSISPTAHDPIDGGC